MIDLSMVGEVVRRYRYGQGLTQVQFAEQCGFNPATLVSIECHYRDPSPNSISKLVARIGDEFLQMCNEPALDDRVTVLERRVAELEQRLFADKIRPNGYLREEPFDSESLDTS